VAAATLAARVPGHAVGGELAMATVGGVRHDVDMDVEKDPEKEFVEELSLFELGRRHATDSVRRLRSVSAIAPRPSLYHDAALIRIGFAAGRACAMAADDEAGQHEFYRGYAFEMNKRTPRVDQD
jgi:hypothetical protein